MQLSSNLDVKSIAANAASIDKEGLAPDADFKWLAEAGLLEVVLPGKPLDFALPNTAALLLLLKQIGGANLAVGRIYEGHINALQLVHLYATAAQKQRWFDDVLNHKVFGVWNTQDNEGISIHDIGNGKYRIEGCKTFCSGSGLVQRPVITGTLVSGDKSGWQMCIVPVEMVAEIPVDKSFWKPLGMRASASFRLNFTDIVIDEEDLLGPPDAYYQQPVFSGGAIRFAAVQLGGAEAILKETVQYLQQLGRTNDPFQKARIAEITYLVEAGNLWVSRQEIKLMFGNTTIRLKRLPMPIWCAPPLRTFALKRCSLQNVVLVPADYFNPDHWNAYTATLLYTFGSLQLMLH